MKQLKKIKVTLILAGLLMLFLSGTQTVYAESKIDINKLKYISGNIDRIASGEIVVDDCLYKYSANVLFLSRKGAKTRTNLFIKGSSVKIHVNKQNQVLIIRKP